MKAASLSFQAAVLMALLGMVWGLVMAVSGDHSTMPALGLDRWHPHRDLGGSADPQRPRNWRSVRGTRIGDRARLVIRRPQGIAPRAMASRVD
jgi:hypothetical protein